MKTIMNKLLIVLGFLLATAALQAQIGINTETPDKSSVLDIESVDKGMLIPRMATSEKLKIELPAHSLLVYDTDLNCLSQNMGTPTVPDWDCLSAYEKPFFYMPSINIPVRDESTDLLFTTDQTIDLYAAYASQFGTPASKDLVAPRSIPYYKREQLYYYLTKSDPCINVTGLSDEGVLKYQVVSAPNYDSFVNIVFVVKSNQAKR